MSASTTGEDRALRSPAAAFASILNVAVEFAAKKLEQKIGGWAEKLHGTGGDRGGGSGAAEVLAPVADEVLDDVAEEGGAAQTAVAEGVKAGLHGENPIWAAIKGTWRSGTPAVRAAIITAAVSAVLLLLLSPVLLIIYLLSLLIAAAVHKERKSESDQAT